jgi:hypothetical protein
MIASSATFNSSSKNNELTVVSALRRRLFTRSSLLRLVIVTVCSQRLLSLESSRKHRAEVRVRFCFPPCMMLVLPLLASPRRRHMEAGVRFYLPPCMLLASTALVGITREAPRGGESRYILLPILYTVSFKSGPTRDVPACQKLCLCWAQGSKSAMDRAVSNQSPKCSGGRLTAILREWRSVSSS